MDWLGTARLNTWPNQSGPDVETADAPFGESYAQTGATDREFAGMAQQQVTTGPYPLYDAMFRNYNPIWGRWLSPDSSVDEPVGPAGLAAASPMNPQSWNRYAYALNNPAILVDPLGLDPCTDSYDCPEPDWVPTMFGGLFGLEFFCGAQYTSCGYNPGTGQYMTDSGSMATLYNPAWWYDGEEENLYYQHSQLVIAQLPNWLLNNPVTDFLANHSNWLPGVCSASGFAYATAGPSYGGTDLQGGVLAQGQVPLTQGYGAQTGAQPFGELSTPVGGVGGTSSGEVFVFAHEPGANTGPVLAFDSSNGGINNKGIFLGWFFGGETNLGQAGPVSIKGQAGVGGGMTFTTAQNCVQQASTKVVF